MMTVAMVAKTLAEAAAKHFAVAKGKELIAYIDADRRLDRALSDDRERIFWTLQQVAIAVAHCISGHEFDDGELAWQLLVAMAEDPANVRRFRALLNAASIRGDERIALLATGYFVGGQPTTLRERLDWALLDLFPDDADALGTIVTQTNQLSEGAQLVVTTGDVQADEMTIVRGVDGLPQEQNPATRIPGAPLRTLERAQCISLVDWLAGRGLATWNSSNAVVGPPKARVLEVLPIGRELHRILGTVDWREIAVRSRRATSNARSSGCAS